MDVDTLIQEADVRLGEIVRVIKGEHEGKLAVLNRTDGFFCHLQLLTHSGRKQVGGLVTLHRSSIAATKQEVKN
jgi:5'(3')-deoxyribonucleotidase